MRSDVKVGLICAFAIVLAVIIYFVAQGNNHPARAANTTPAADTTPLKVAAPAPALTPAPTVPAVAPAAETSLTTGLPAPSAPVASPVTERLLAAGPVGGGPIIPPAPGAGATPSASPIATPITGPTPATPTTPSMTSSTPTFASPSIIRSPGSGSDSLIPSPAPAPAVRPTLEFTTPSSSLTGSGSSTTYEIQKGDMLGPIAKKFGVSVKAIEAANPGINPNNLKVKSTIKIPAAGSGSTGSTVSTHTPATGHTPATPTVSTAVSSTPKAGATYKVKKGDTLTDIAKAAYGSGSKATIEKIVAANHAITNPNVLALNTELKFALSHAAGALLINGEALS